MKKHLPKILFVLFVGGILFAAWSIIRAVFVNGERTLKGILLAPFNAAEQVFAGVTALYKKAGDATGVTAAASLPSLTSTETALHDTTQTTAFNDYAPGGRIYNNILQTQGQAAADAAWQSVQDHYATEAAQTSSDSSLWGFGDLFGF